MNFQYIPGVVLASLPYVCLVVHLGNVGASRPYAATGSVVASRPCLHLVVPPGSMWALLPCKGPAVVFDVEFAAIDCSFLGLGFEGVAVRIGVLDLGEMKGRDLVPDRAGIERNL